MRSGALPRLVGQSDSLRRARVANIRGKGKEVIRELCRREQGGRIWQHETCDKDIIEIIITDAIGTTGPVKGSRRGGEVRGMSAPSDQREAMRERQACGKVILRPTQIGGVDENRKLPVQFCDKGVFPAPEVENSVWCDRKIVEVGGSGDVGISLRIDSDPESDIFAIAPEVSGCHRLAAGRVHYRNENILDAPQSRAESPGANREISRLG